MLFLKPPPDFPIDWDYIQNLADGDNEFALELLQVFVQDLQSQLPNLQKAIAIENYIKIQESAHYLKGASGNVGAREMHSLMQSLEKQAKAEVIDGAELIYATTAQYFEIISQWVASASH
ncbi:Hpt domain-containing protein [Prochlorothrix hollandica]|uniref:HPt domain-containing protein n=1 Tax=Prochlorothrix hollandica PCC 9006 = CALU 1027 TaxID=317619 RepID=A0A0M2Q0Y5_PROHO|nr:Hpt domain-containing protein [Prochlorothrix hollandica]KKJ00302.1 hypothetical protein PROH_11530 [Prochlorothrix hollandica PCC 9006 = CALU 1027]